MCERWVHHLYSNNSPQKTCSGTSSHTSARICVTCASGSKTSYRADHRPPGLLPSQRSRWSCSQRRRLAYAAPLSNQPPMIRLNNRRRRDHVPIGPFRPRLLSRLFHYNINQCFNFPLAIVEAVWRVSEAGATITGLEHHRLRAEYGSNASGGEVHVLDRAACVRGERSSQLVRRNDITHEFDFASRDHRFEAVSPCTTRSIDELWPFRCTNYVRTSGLMRRALDESRNWHFQCVGNFEKD
jgi:hypothetical protein